MSTVRIEITDDHGVVLVQTTTDSYLLLYEQDGASRAVGVGAVELALKWAMPHIAPYLGQIVAALGPMLPQLMQVPALRDIIAKLWSRK